MPVLAKTPETLVALHILYSLVSAIYNYFTAHTTYFNRLQGKLLQNSFLDHLVDFSEFIQLGAISVLGLVAYSKYVI